MLVRFLSEVFMKQSTVNNEKLATRIALIFNILCFLGSLYFCMSAYYSFKALKVKSLSWQEPVVWTKPDTGCRYILNNAGEVVTPDLGSNGFPLCGFEGDK